MRGRSSTRHSDIRPSTPQLKARYNTAVPREQRVRQIPRHRTLASTVKSERKYSSIERAVSERAQRYQTPRHRTLNPTIKSERVYRSIARQCAASEREQPYQAPSMRHTQLHSQKRERIQQYPESSEREDTAVPNRSIIPSTPQPNARENTTVSRQQ